MERVELFAFSGTGNTYHVAAKLAEALRSEGVAVELRLMEKNMSPEIGEDSIVGLAMPVACFSSYPTALNFIDSLPPGGGRKIFMICTMGGAGLGMQGPIRRQLVEKGYSPIAFKLFVMPGNYGRKEIPTDKNSARIEKTEAEVLAFAKSLCAGAERWQKTWTSPFAAMMYRLACGRRPWNMFYRFFPIQVDEKKCNVCGRCLRLCPTGAMKMNGEFPAIDKKLCQSCQRCVGFCPQHAIQMPGKPTAQYSFMAYDEFIKFGKE